MRMLLTTMISGDILEIDPVTIKDMYIEMTVLGGTIIYEKK